MRELAHRIVHARRFEYLLVFLILGSAILQGVAISVLPEEIGTSDQPLKWFHYGFAPKVAVEPKVGHLNQKSWR